MSERNPENDSGFGRSFLCPLSDPVLNVGVTQFQYPDTVDHNLPISTFTALKRNLYHGCAFVEAGAGGRGDGKG